MRLWLRRSAFSLALLFSAAVSIPLALQAQTSAPPAAASVAPPAPKPAKPRDFAALQRYAAEDAALEKNVPGRVVFFGDSITDAWGRKAGADPWFPGKPYVNRGISGQTTPQMLLRFREDVVDLHPAAVIVLAGTNDIAGNSGPESLEQIEGYFRSMYEIAHANGIRFIVCSITPVFQYPWSKDVEPVESIRALNDWLRDFATQHDLVYVDYFTALADAKRGMREGDSKDGVHPTPQGYAIMAPLAQAGIDAALKRKP